jgi:hypothetical protein
MSLYICKRYAFDRGPSKLLDMTSSCDWRMMTIYSPEKATQGKLRSNQGLGGLPRRARFQQLSRLQMAHFHAHHVMVFLVPKVRHGLGFGSPRVPHHCLGEP